MVCIHVYSLGDAEQFPAIIPLEADISNKLPESPFGESDDYICISAVLAHHISSTERITKKSVNPVWQPDDVFISWLLF